MSITRRGILAGLGLIALAGPSVAEEADKKPWNPEAPYDTDIVVGSPRAPVTVVEYASLTCPHCARFFNEAWPEFRKRWVDTGKARFVYRHLPLDQSALAAALTVACVPAEGRERLLAALFAGVKDWAPKQDIAPVVGKVFGDAVKMEDVMACISEKGFPQKVMQAGTDAVNNGVDATPTFFVGGKQVVGFHTAEALGKMVDDRIAEEVLK